MNTKILNYLWVIVIAVSCTSKSKLELALEYAGENRGELEKVLAHYRDSGLKYDAAVFLIENMPFKMTLEYNIYDRTGALVKVDGLHEVTQDVLLDSLSCLRFEKSKRIYDIEHISSQYLIRNIDYSFYLRENYPWCKALDFIVFCEQILPYRITSEPLSDWKEYYYSKYKPLLDSLQKTNALLDEIVFIINEKCGKEYLSKMNTVPSNVDYKLIELVNGGTCDHLAHNAAQLMRSFGVPLNIDIMPYHGKVNGGHTYNSFYNEKGDFRFFSPYERDVERNKWVAPLIFRVSYKHQKKVFESIDKNNQLLFNWAYKNVTNEYYSVSEIFLTECGRNNEVYLATYNRGAFKLVNHAKAKNGSCLFNDVSNGLLYFPMVSDNSILKHVSHPFIMTSQGAADVKIESNTRRVSIDSVKLYDGTRNVKVVNGVYELRGWDNGWETIKTIKAHDGDFVNFGEVQSYPLFLVKNSTYIGEIQRPFSKTESGYVYY